MIILQFVENYAHGGAEKLAVAMANGWAERGHTSHFVVAHGTDEARGMLSPEGKYSNLRCPFTAPRLPRKILQMRAAARALSDLLEREGIGIVQAHLPQANFLLTFLGQRDTVRLLPTLHNTREFEYSHKTGGLHAWLRRRFYRALIQRTSATIAVSPDVRAQAMTEFGVDEKTAANKIVVVPNGVPRPPAISSIERQDLRRRWSVEEDQVLICAAGRQTPQKNFAGLVDALAQCPAPADRWCCVIAGEGELLSALRQHIQRKGLGQRVRTVGWLPDLNQLLAAADVFCISSLFEGMPLVLLEAMSHGLPICAFEAPGVTSLLTGNRDALLAPPGDRDQFCTNLTSLIMDPPFRRSLGEAGRARFEEEWEFDRMMEHLDQVYRGMA